MSPQAIALDIVKRCARWDGSEPDEDPEELIAQAIADAEQRGRESERADVVAYLTRVDGTAGYAHDINTEMHLGAADE